MVKKEIKKSIALLMAAVTVMGIPMSVAAAETTELSVFWWGNQVRNERTQTVLELFENEHEGVKIEGQFADGTDYWPRLATMTAGGTLTDVVQMEYSYLSQYGENGTLIDLTPYIEDGTIDVSNVPESTLNAGYVDGKLCGILLSTSADCLFYNKTLLDEAGITVNDYMTIEEFKALCMEVYEKTGYKTGLTYGSGTSSHYMEYLLRAHDKQLYKDGLYGVDGAEDFVEYFKLIQDGIEEGWHVNPSVYVERQEGSIEQDCMVYGENPENMSWCAFYSANQLPAFQAAAPEGMELGITTMPSSDPMKSICVRPSQYWCITETSDNPDEAAELINYMLNSVEANKVLMTDRGVPASSVVGSEIEDVLSKEEKEFASFVNEVIAPYAAPCNPPDPSNSTEIKSVIKTLSEQILYGEMEAEEAAEQMYIQGTEILSEE